MAFLRSLAVLAAIPFATVQSATTPAQSVDYVIVGAGPAGYVTAEVLSRNPSTRVIVLEAGPDSRTDPNITTPGNVIQASSPNYLWEYNSQPDPNLNGATPNIWQGRTLGGGSAVNAMTYCRGSESLFDSWAEISGNDGLKWSNIYRDFQRVTHYGNQAANYSEDINPSAFGNGPVEVSRASELDVMQHPFLEAFEQSEGLQQADFDSGVGIGTTLGLNSVRVSNRTRSYAANTYGYILEGRRNVQVLPNSWVSKIGFNGVTAVNVTYTSTLTNKVTTLAGRQIILAGGAINTPHLLMLSGVGNATNLQQYNIPVVKNIPAIGQNLYDHHYSGIVVQATSNVDTFYQLFQNMTSGAVFQAEYKANYSGPLGNVYGGEWVAYRLNNSAFDGVNGTHYTSLPADRPHILSEFAAFPVYTMPNVSSASSWAALVQPEAAGYMALGSADYTKAPLIYSNYYGSAADKAAIIAGYKQLRANFESAPLKPFEIKELFPGSNVTSDADIWAAIQQSASSFHHPIGTCAIGSVVDSHWRVKGLNNLRIVDSSTFPYLPTCHTQSSAYALAHVAAKDILRDDSPQQYHHHF